MEEISLAQFEQELSKALSEAEAEVEEDMDGVLEDAGQRLLKKLRTGKKHGGRTPEDTGEYAEGWEEHTEFRGVDRVRVIRNESKPQLTHLLEYGRKGDGKEKIGQRQHIRRAILETIDEITDELK